MLLRLPYLQSYVQALHLDKRGQNDPWKKVVGAHNWGGRRRQLLHGLSVIHESFRSKDSIVIILSLIYVNWVQSILQIDHAKGQLMQLIIFVFD